ncbi:hypothetical protein EDB83DRAFT_1979771 [Lactarius deliciosus]|nr:hypothetical protein EDB83DRAFT_1979771 [Lactarius deliciosus]
MIPLTLVPRCLYLSSTRGDGVGDRVRLCLETIFLEMPSVPSNLEGGPSDKLFDDPDANANLYSRYRQEFRVQKLYIAQSTPVLGDLMRAASDAANALNIETFTAWSHGYLVLEITQLKQKSTNPVDVFVDKISRCRRRWINVASGLRVHITTIAKPQHRAALSLCHHFYATIAFDTSM